MRSCGEYVYYAQTFAENCGYNCRHCTAYTAVTADITYMPHYGGGTETVMKYKILLNGRNSALVTDFLQYTETYFKCMSTSSSLKDVMCHFEYFEPDAYLGFVDSAYDEFITQIPTLKENRFYNGAPIIMIGDIETCDDLEAHAMNLPDLMIKRPISPDNLALRINRFLDKAKEEAEAAKAAEAAQTPETEQAAETPAEEENARKHILVVDDDRSILKLLKTALSDEYDVTTIANGLLVEKVIQSKKVDLILLDYEMPIETGADVFRKLKKNEKAKDIPVCFLTGVAERSKIVEIMTLKPHGYMLKPIDMDMLRSTIMNLIN